MHNYDKFRKQFRSLWGIMPPSPSSCMACLQIQYEPDHSKPNGYDPAVCCIKDGNVYFECISAGNNLSTTKFYDQDNQHTNIRTNLKKHMTIKNERHIKTPIYRQRWRDWTESILDTKLTKPFICSNNTMRHTAETTTHNKFEFKHKNLELISGSYCPLQLLLVCGEKEEGEEAAVLYATIGTKCRHLYM